MIAAALLGKVAAALGPGAAGPEAIPGLRKTFEGVHFTHCLEDEVTATIEPAFEGEGFNLYLVDGSDHCMQLTRDLDAATGILVAEVEDDA